MVEMTGRRGRRHTELLEEKREYWKLKEEALGLSLWRTRCGRDYAPVVRQTTGPVNFPFIFSYIPGQELHCLTTLLG
jgi:hypothetical protein